MVRVKSPCSQSTSVRASFPHLALRQRCRDHPIAMFHGLVFASFVWVLVPTGSVLTPLSAWTDDPGPIQIARTTAKTSRLPKTDVIHSCPEQDGGRDWLECLTEFAHEVGNVDAFFG